MTRDETSGSDPKASSPRSLPLSLLLACALGALLGADALRGALLGARLGGELDAVALARGIALVGVALGCAWTRRSLLALAQVALALWVYTDLAPVVGEIVASGFAHARFWLRPLPIAAFAFFPSAFFGWRALARGPRARTQAETPLR